MIDVKCTVTEKYKMFSPFVSYVLGTLVNHNFGFKVVIILDHKQNSRQNVINVFYILEERQMFQE